MGLFAWRSRFPKTLRRKAAVKSANFLEAIESHSRDAVIRVCDAAGNVIETHEHTGDWPHPVKNASPARTCSDGRVGDNSRL
jgi:hypothetical protein